MHRNPHVFFPAESKEEIPDEALSVTSDEKSKIAIVPLEFKDYGDKFYHYLKLPFKDKITFLEDKIKKICHELKQFEPHSLWIIICREKTLTDEGNYLSDEHKKEYKNFLKKITKAYPQLLLMPGSILARKDINDTEVIKEKLKKIRATYDYLNYFYEIEMVINDPAMKEQIDPLDHFEKLIAANEIHPIALMRNTVYAAYKGNIVFRHSKQLPIREFNFNVIPNGLFHPGSEEKSLKGNISGKSTFELAHPIDGKMIPLGIEICRENLLGLLKYKLNQSGESPPLIYILMSAYIQATLSLVPSKYNVHCDSRFRSQLFLSKLQGDSPHEVTFYVSRMFHANAKLEKREEIVPLQWQIEAIAHELIVSSLLDPPDNNKIDNFIYQFRKYCEEAEESNDVIYDAADELIKKLKQTIMNATYLISPDRNKAYDYVDEIETLVQTEQVNYPRGALSNRCVHF